MTDLIKKLEAKIIEDGRSRETRYALELLDLLRPLIKTLQDIADEDFRGNRSPGSVKAYHALADLRTRLETK